MPMLYHLVIPEVKPIELKAENFGRLLNPLCLSCFSALVIALFEIIYGTLILILPSFIELFESNNSDQDRSERVNYLLDNFFLPINAIDNHDLFNRALEVPGYHIIIITASYLFLIILRLNLYFFIYHFFVFLFSGFFLIRILIFLQM